jgi:hypothetical protein
LGAPGDAPRTRRPGLHLAPIAARIPGCPSLLSPAPPAASDTSSPNSSPAIITTWFLVARRADKLAQIATELQGHGVTVKTIALDLAAPPAPKFLFDQLQREGIVIDILVNNAGFGTFGEFTQMPEPEIGNYILGTLPCFCYSGFVTGRRSAYWLRL